MILRHLFTKHKPLIRLSYNFANLTSSIFKLHNRENLLNLNQYQRLHQQNSLSNENQDTLNKIPLSNHQHSKTAFKELDEIEQKDDFNEKQQVSEQQHGQIIQEEGQVTQIAQNCIRQFNDQKTKLFFDAKFGQIQKLVETTLKTLKNKTLKQNDLIELFSIIRSIRVRNQNVNLFSKSLQNKLRLFILQNKNSKTMKNISQNWNSYDTLTLLKLTSLYRYLPVSTITQSLIKLFSLHQSNNLGYLKHLEIITEILQKKQKIYLGQLNHSLILNGQILYQTFKHHFSDFQIVMRFTQVYQAFGASKLFGGLLFNHITFIGKPDRKGYVYDYEFLKHAFSVYYSCVNLRSKIKLKFIEQMPESVRLALDNSNPKLDQLLDGFFGLSNFSNCNEYFGRIVAQSVKEAEPKQIKQNIDKIHVYLRYLLESLKSEYCLNSMQKPNAHIVTQSTINTIRVILPLVIDSFVLELLEYEFDPFVYKLLFKNEEQFQPFLNKYCHLLQNNNIQPLSILRLLSNNIDNINPNSLKLKTSLQLSWRTLNKQYHKWPQCLPYYYYFSKLSNHLNFTIKDLSKFIKSFDTKIKKQQGSYQQRPSVLLPIVTSSFKNLEYLLPILQQNDFNENFKNPVIKTFIQKQVKRAIKNWDTIPYYRNLQVIIQHPNDFSNQFMQTVAQNLSLLTMVDNQISILHPDIDKKTMKSICQIFLSKKVGIENVDLRVLQMLCLSSQDLLRSNNNIQKLIQILGYKEQKYIPEMVEFIEQHRFDKKQIESIITLLPPTFKNIDVDNYINEKKSQQDYNINNSRQIKKYLTILLDNPKMKLKQQLKLKDLPSTEEKALYLCNKLYEAILKSQQETDEVIKQIYQIFPPQINGFSSILRDEEQKINLYQQFDINQKQTVNTKYQLLKFRDVDAEQFETVELLDHPIEEEILRNISRPNKIENQIIMKLNDDIKEPYESLKHWFDRMSIQSKIRNNTLILKGREKRIWQKSIFLIVSKPEVFKLNLICTHILNMNSDVEFVVIEEESSVQNSIKNFVYKKHNHMA